eukprot:329070-Chlamydomonas_euryale.AAC.1
MDGKSPSKLDADGQAHAAACAFLEVQQAQGHIQMASNSQAIVLMESTWQPRMVRLAECPAKNTTVPCADRPTKVIINVATAAERRKRAKELEVFGFPPISNAAMRLLSMHATSAAASA